MRSKQVQKSFNKWIKPNELIKKVTFNSNNTRSAKYGFPERGQQYKEAYNFSRLWRIKEAQSRSERYAKNLDA